MNTSTDPAAPPVPDFVGSIDGVTDGTLSGWAVTIQGDPSEVRITVNGQEFPAIVAEHPRPDLQIAGQAKGQGGWRLDIGAALRDGENRIEAIFPDRSRLSGSPLVFTGLTPIKAAPLPAEDAPLRYVGAIDNQHPPSLTGWAISSACKAVPVTIEIEGRATIEVASSDPRADLAKQGLSDGDGGWHYDIGAIGAPPMAVHIRFPDGTELPGSPLRYNQPAPDDLPPPEAAAAAADTEIVPPPQPAPEAISAAPPAPTAPVPVASAPASPEPAREKVEPASVTRLTPRPQSGPSLAELDEISLDDLAAAVEAGIIYVPPPPPPPPEPEVVESAPAARRGAPERKGFFARLLGR
jgi:hypothetical protein